MDGAPADPHEPDPVEFADATRLIARLRDGDQDAASELLPIVYDELRARAGAFFRGQRSDHTLQPTALVHEAFLKLAQSESNNWLNRANFCAVAATAMRQILADHARAKMTAKRGGGMRRQVTTIAAPSSDGAVDLLALHEALEKLADIDARQAHIVELRFFGGLTIEETAAVLDVSESVVERSWRRSRAWLRVELDGAPPTATDNKGSAS